jgi:general secretion pathway protein M
MSSNALSTASFKDRWDALAPRERRWVAGAAVLVAAALLWWIAIAPALATLRLAQVQHQQLDAQLQQMQTLKSQAVALQSQPKMAAEEARRALDALLKQNLGNAAQTVSAGDRVTVTLKAVSGDVLAQTLTQARVNARVLPVEVKLVKSLVAPVNPGTAGAASGALWDGSVVFKFSTP